VQQRRELLIEVRDNGLGFDPTAVAERGHYGLLGLRERVRLLGGQFVIVTAPGQGTTLRLLLPATRKAGEI
jgi:NarL family two-component system sensor histidine kinase YdfH